MSSIDTLLEQELLREDHMKELIDDDCISDIDSMADTDPETSDVEITEEDEYETLEYLSDNHTEEDDE